MAFEKRHLPLSDGKDHDKFKGIVSAPKVWSQETPTRPSRKNRRAKPLVENNKEEAMVEKDPAVMVCVRSRHKSIGSVDHHRVDDTYMHTLIIRYCIFVHVSLIF